jgi:hypothetical protein
LKKLLPHNYYHTILKKIFVSKCHTEYYIKIDLNHDINLIVIVIRIVFL